MSKFADRIRETIFNLERTPGHRNDEEYDPRISTPIQEAIDLLKDLMVTELTLKATPGQIEALSKLMTEETLNGYSCMLLEEFEATRVQNPEAAQAFLAGAAERTKARVNVPVEPEQIKGIDGRMHKPGEEPYLEDGWIKYPGRATLLGYD